MQIHGDKEALVEIGQSVLRVVSPRATLPVLGGVKITAGRDNSVEFAATDLEIFITVKGEFSVAEQGSIVVPGRLFGEILRSLPSGKVTIEGTDSDIKIESGRSEFSVTGYSVSDFPQAPQVNEGSVCTVPGAELARSLRQVVRAVSTDEARPVLTGVLWAVEGGSLRLVSTDSYRLAVREVVVKEGPSEGRSIIPGRALAEFARHLAGVGDEEVSITLGESQASFVAGNTQLTTRLIEGEFPNWRHLVPDGYQSKLVIDREEFTRAVERVGLVARANTPVKFHLGDEVQLTATEAGVADASEVVEGGSYSGEPMTIAFNPRFFNDGLDGLESDKAELEVIDPTKPAILRAEGRDDFIYLLMPVRLAG
ncbi:MAG: DNA polymerase III subunit beta [Actinomycetota bacterium]|nr:DNA polymerase III subunit beta [Actinomycetota bacterium]